MDIPFLSTSVYRKIKSQFAEDEYEVAVFHRHPLYLVRSLLYIIALIAFGWVVVLFSREFRAIFDIHQSLPWIVVVYAILVGLLAIIFYSNWRQNFIVFTNKRIISFHSHALLFTHHINVNRKQLLNLAFANDTLGARLFNYGTLEIDTGDHRGTIIFSMAKSNAGNDEVLHKISQIYA